MIRHDWTIYADGSHKDGRISGGWRLTNGGTGRVIDGQASFGEGTNIYAELLAIIHALKAVPTDPAETRVIVYTDSEWCVKAITGEYNAKRYVTEIIEACQLLRRFAAAGIFHTPAHVGHAGNERADRLAKAARTPAVKREVHLMTRTEKHGAGTLMEIVGVGDTPNEARDQAVAEGHPNGEAAYAKQSFCFEGRA